jgi:hypothetical protein
VNKEMYIHILHRFRAAVRKKRPEKWKIIGATTHWSVLIKDFLAKKNATTLEHPQYHPDLAAADF